MKKIGILTYHSSINYGAFLQAYSLTKCLEQKTGLYVEIIDYTAFKIRLFYIVKVIAAIIHGNFLQNFKQYFVFIKSQRQLTKSKRVKISNYKKLCSFLNNNYDVIVVGSDEVLSSVLGKLRPFPNIYWPNKIVTIPKLTYAGSANKVDYSKLDKEKRDFLKLVMSDYKYIGVRDEHTYNQVLNLDSKLKPYRNGDPTFLHNFNHSHMELKENLRKRLEQITSKPIISIMTKDEQIGKLIKEKYSKDFFIMAVYYPNKYADYFYSDMSPFEWAVGFSIYAACVTQMFHATVFSIKNNLPFISIDNNVRYDGKVSKIYDLLKYSDLLENYFNKREEGFSNEKIIRQLDKNLKYPQITKMKDMLNKQISLYDSFQAKLTEVIEN